MVHVPLGIGISSLSVKSLNQHILRLAGGLLLISTLSILANVILATVDHAKGQLSDNLKVAESVFKQVLSGRDEQLFNSADVLTSDFGFKQAVATQDRGTIKSALVNHGNRVSADIMVVIDLKGTIISSSISALNSDDPFPYSDLLDTVRNKGGSSSLLLFDGRLYQSILLTVDAPRPIAYALVGFELNSELLYRLRTITQLETTIEFISNGELKFTGSTLKGTALKQAQQQTDTNISWFSVSLLGDIDYISKRFSVPSQGDNEIWVTLSYEADRLFGEFNKLQLKVTIIALISITLSLLLGALFSKELSKPLGNLSRVARKIASGQYGEDISVASNTKEIDELTQSFRTMQHNISQRQQQITYQARHDHLTGLQNRYSVSEVMYEKFATGQPFQVVVANILGFRGVNDLFGYQNGDLCLRLIADRFKKLGGECSRLNGGEFLWLPDSHVDENQLEHLQANLELPVVVEDVVMNIRISLGLLECPKDSHDTEGVLRRASICLDEARKSENARAIYQKEFEANYLRRLSIISDLKTALWDDSNELSVFYQPKLHIVTGKITNAEALIRWNSEKLGFVPPDEFIGIAEQADLIGDVTQWVVNRVIKDVRYMRDQQLNINVAINLSAKDVINKSLLPDVVKQLRSLELSNDCLSFEITESDLVADPRNAIDELKKFREAGFSLAIDDFGTGYSSLAYLKSLPVSELKIDKSFVLTLDTQKGDQQIVQTILELAHNFGLGVIAEGVENKEALNMLKDWGCEWVQGYHICRPIPLEDMIKWHHETSTTNWFE